MSQCPKLEVIGPRALCYTTVLVDLASGGSGSKQFTIGLSTTVREIGDNAFHSVTFVDRATGAEIKRGDNAVVLVSDRVRIGSNAFISTGVQHKAIPAEEYAKKYAASQKVRWAEKWLAPPFI